MSELMERRWAVVSEHGAEALGLSYDEAKELAGSLNGDKVRGLCIVTDNAARHLTKEDATTNNAPPREIAHSAR